MTLEVVDNNGSRLSYVIHRRIVWIKGRVLMKRVRIVTIQRIHVIAFLLYSIGAMMLTTVLPTRRLHVVWGHVVPVHWSERIVLLI